MDPLLAVSVRGDVTLSYDLGLGLYAIQTDPAYFETMLLNLVVNAVDAMPNGGNVFVKTENVYLDKNYCFLSPDLEEGHYMCLSITDTGCGMSRKELGRIFEPFYTTKQSGQGTGLGLSSVYGYVKDMKGYIHTYSEIGQGTCFQIYLPAHGTDDIVAFPHVKSDAFMAPSAQTKAVLIVDDHYLMQDLAAESFKRLGCDVYVAKNLKEAETLCRAIKKPFDLMFVDVFLGQGLTGVEVVKSLKQSGHNAKNIIYTSGFDSKRLAQMDALQGEIFIAKPFSNKALCDLLKDIWPDAGF